MFENGAIESMKTLKLALGRVAYYFRYHKLILVLFLLGMVACVLAFAFFYGTTALQKMEATNAVLSRQYDVQLFSAENIEESRLSFLEQHDVEEILYTAPLDKSALQGKIPDTDDMGEKIAFTVKAFQNNNEAKLLYLDSKSSFTDEELEQNCVIAPAAIHYKDERVTINGVKYSVVGKYDGMGDYDFYMPVKAYQNVGFQTKSLQITLKQIPTEEENERLVAEINAAFHGSAVTDPYQYIMQKTNKNATDLLTFCAIYLISICSFLFLLKYLLDRNQYENAVYSIAGASKNRVIRIAVCEILILSMGSAVFALLLHALLYDSVFQYINVYANVTYTFFDYLAILGMIFVLTLLCAVPFIVMYKRSSLIAFKNKSV